MSGRRILHVTDCYSTGVGLAIDTLVALTPEHEHHLLHAGELDPAGKGYASAHPLPHGHLARVRAVRDTAERLVCDVVHAHSSRAGVYARATRLPAEVVYQPHCYKMLDGSLAAPARAGVALVEGALARRADQVVVLTAQEESWARRLSRSTPRVLVPNSAPLRGRVDRVPPEQGPRPRRVVMSGRVAPQKDPGYLAEVADRLHDLDPDVEVLWVGGVDDEGLADRLGAAGVTITGWCGPEETAAYLRSGGVYLHSARYEGFPLSVLDAAWCGLPVVVRDIPAFEGTSLVRVGGPEEAARTVHEVLAQGPALERAWRGAADLLDATDPQVQQARLRELYHPAR